MCFGDVRLDVCMCRVRSRWRVDEVMIFSLVISVGVYDFVYIFLCLFFFFFSSRRRHTRCSRDWSSDVCSSDLCRSLQKRLDAMAEAQKMDPPTKEGLVKVGVKESIADGIVQAVNHYGKVDLRSEERRVGKECRSGWWLYNGEKKRVGKEERQDC